MSAPLIALQRCIRQSSLFLVAWRWYGSTPATTLPLHKKILTFLSKHFRDVEMFTAWNSERRLKWLRDRNESFFNQQHLFGQRLASCFLVLSLKGGFRFVGQTEWICSTDKDILNKDFENHKDTPLEEVDLSYTVINYNGLLNIGLDQPCLRTLSLRGCPEVDDWFLAGLHVFQDSLKELDISHCPKITTGGLAALRNLKGLTRLNMSSLPGISNPGLVIILMEEMLPHCQITATGYKHLKPEAEVQ
ncbi:distal membrane-arm assembly complex protein 2 [Synchiropus splendidus]|uniref:distal membrane-arm assembly complex protein 2 n=1 Tax=Synchiropus splendidus TaxID=270530 RepID=UPI00237E7E70|nr:distal membrane-arm assembly complex protein 2 [Synchiropus splendidus]